MTTQNRNTEVKSDSDQGDSSNKVPAISKHAAVTDEQVINWINSRRSVGNLTIPAPNEAQVRAAIACAVTAPDHKKLRPWRFIVLQGNERHQLGRALLQAAEAKAEADGDSLDEASRDKTLRMPLRAPMIITVVTQMSYHEKVPEFEQLLSTGAAVQNLILALKAQGFGSVWRTGLLCNEPAVKAYLGVGADDYVCAFVYTGTSACQMPERGEIDIKDVVSFK